MELYIEICILELFRQKRERESGVGGGSERERGGSVERYIYKGGAH